MEYNADFCIKFDFTPSSMPKRVFDTLSAFLEAMENIDSLLAKTISPTLACSYTLTAISAGSLTAYIKEVLEETDDRELKKGNYLALIGSFLLKAKYGCLSYLDRHNGLGERNELMEFADNIHSMALQSGANQFNAYHKPSVCELGKGMKKISDALQQLEQGEILSFKREDQCVAFNNAISISPDDIERLLVERTYTSTSKMILKVRKPDFLGNSKWDFRHSGQNISASINDLDWLAKFQNGENDFRPGVSLDVECTTTTAYGYDNEALETSMSIEKVNGILPKPEQLSLL